MAKRAPKKDVESPAEKRPLFPIVGVGASAGGLQAFESMFAELPVSLDAAVVFIQHLPADHKNLLPELLHAKFPARKIVEIAGGTTIEPGTLYVAPSASYLALRNNVFRVRPMAKQGVHLPIDAFFTSLAETAQEWAIAVVLSGGGSDGARGIREVQCKGGAVLVQNPAGAEFSFMPAAALATGCVDEILPPAELGRHLTKLIKAFQGLPSSEELAKLAELDALFNILHEKAGFRFEEYKRNVIARRVHRRMSLHGVPSVAEYVDLINRTPAEIGQLASDMMIGVTAFFRDPDAWEILRKTVVHALVSEKKPAETIRVWAPACSTGEEAYSIATMFLREIEKAGKRNDFQVFASDVKEASLAVARDGKYPGSVSADIPPEYLKAYFTCMEDGVSLQINKYVRDHIVFAKQNILSDPPFSRLDLVICRNLLIYLEQPAQSKCLSIFHYALKDDGYLFLGNAESLGQQKGLFKSLGDKNCRIYKRLAQSKPVAYHFPTAPAARARDAGAAGSTIPSDRSVTEFAHELLLSLYAPATLIINSRYEILYLHGSVQRYVQPPAGQFSADFISWVPEESRNRLRGALYAASQNPAPVEMPVTLPREGVDQAVTLRIQQYVSPTDKSDLFLIVFEGGSPESEPVQAIKASEVETATVRQLERELGATRDELQTNIEELKSANEELQSSNEELQASNEEMETSREEIQSVNEELVTVNSQLQSKVEEQETTNNDLNNFVSSSNIPTLFLDHQFNVRRFSPAMTGLLKLIPTDIGRPIVDMPVTRLGPDLLDDAKVVLDKLSPITREVAIGEAWYLRSTLPFRTSDNRIEGVVITCVDITNRKRMEADLDQLARFPSENPNPILRVTKAGLLLYANEASAPLLRMWNCATGSAMPDPIRQTISETFAGGTQAVVDVECNDRVYSFSVVPIVEAGYVNLYGRDVTERKSAEEALRESEAKYKLLTESIIDSFTAVDEDLRYTYWNKIAEEMTGIRAKDAIGKTVVDLFGDNEHSQIAIGHYRECLKTGRPSRHEDENEIRGKKLFYEVQISRTDKGVSIVTRDMTARRRAEEALKESEERFRSLAESLPDQITRFDRGLRLTYANRAVLQRTGLPLDELVGRRIAEYGASPTTSDLWEKCARRVIETHEPQKYEIATAWQGQERSVEVQVVPEKDLNGLVQSVVAIAHDITERKRAEDELAFQAQLLSEVHDAVFSSDSNYTITYWNQAAEKMFGWTKEEALGKNSGELLKPKVEGSSRDWERSKLREEGFYEGEVQFTRKDGTCFLVDLNSAALRDANGKDIGNLVVSRDITERKKAEEALRENAARMSAVFNSVSETLMLMDLDGKIVAANKRAAERLNQGEAGFVGKNLYDLIPKHFHEPRKKQIAELVRTKKPLKVLDALDNSVLELTFYPVLDDNGEVSQFVTFTLDITERVHAEEALRESERKFAIMFHAAPVGLSMASLPDGAMYDVNQTWLDMFGAAQKEDVIGKTTVELGLIPQPEQRERILKEYKQEGSVKNGEMTFTAKSGEQRFLLVNVETIILNGRKFMLSTNQDITELKRSEEALRQSEERYRYLFNSLIEGYCIVEMVFDANNKPIDYRFLEVNEAFEEQTGLKNAQGKLMRDLAPSHETFWFETYGNVALTGKPVQFTNEARELNRWFDVKAFRVGGSESRRVAICFSDISKRKQAELATLQSQARLEAVFATIPDVVVEYDANGKLIRANDAAFKVAGLNSMKFTKDQALEALKARNLDGTPVQSDDAPATRALRGETPKHQPYVLTTTDGGELTIDAYAAPLLENGKVTGVVSLWHDITDLKRTENALRESEERFRNMFERHGAVMLLIEPQSGAILDANMAASIFYGYTHEQLCTMRIDQINQLPANDVHGERQRAVDEQRNYFVFPHKLANSQIRWVEVYSTPIDLQGNAALFSIVHDITERKMAEDALHESEERFKAIAEATPVGVGVVGLPDTKFLYVNQSYLKSFGYAESEILGHESPEIYLDQSDRDQVLAILKEEGEVTEYQVRLKRKDGSPFWALASVRPIVFSGKRALLGAYVDITERKKAEDEIRLRADELKAMNDELERFNRAMVDRELRMIELKRLVNELSVRAGEQPRFDLSFADDERAAR